MPKVLTIFTNNVEEAELVVPCDLMVRAGIENTLVAVATNGVKAVKSKGGLTIGADALLEDVAKGEGDFDALAKKYDALFLPGGPSTWPLLDDGRAAKIAKAFATQGKIIAAICAAPLILNAAGLLEGKKISAHFCTWDELPAAKLSPPVAKDGNLITARGAGVAVAFGLAIVEALCGSATAETVASETMA